MGELLTPPLTQLLTVFRQPAALVRPGGSFAWLNEGFRGLFAGGAVPAGLDAWEGASPPDPHPLWETLLKERTQVRRMTTSHGVRSLRLRLLPGPAGDFILVCDSVQEPGFQELRDRTAILEAIFHSLNEGVMAIDAEERIMAMSHSAERLTGFAEAEVVGRRCREVFQAPADAECPFQEMVRRREAIRHREMELRGKGARPIHVNVNASLLKDPAGEVAGAVVVLSDLSELDTLRQQVRGSSGNYGIVGNHLLVRRLIEKIETVAPSEASILILGESGTGKELVAKALHELSPRSAGPFVKVNCAALSDNLLESELFGHVRGAFTGAVKDRPGRFEAAHGGTLFLDEIGETSPALQVKLLRVLQEGEFERVGESRPRVADVRVLAATNKDLRREVAHGRFRDDLFFRLCVVPLDLPPLRDRRDDIPLLVDHFLKRLAAREGRRKIVTPSVYPILQRYGWPGNVRELENAVAHAFVCSGGDTIGPAALPEHILHGETPFSPEEPHSEERRTIRAALEATGWNKGEAAQRLGLSRTTLWRRMRDLGISDPRRPAPH